MPSKLERQSIVGLAYLTGTSYLIYDEDVIGQLKNFESS